MSLSIIIPVYNEDKQLLNTINKFDKISKIIKKYEILFIDDFSTDNTKNVLKKTAKKNRKIKYYKNTKKGLGPAINLGIMKSKEKFICIGCSFRIKIFKRVYGQKLSVFKNDT